MFDGLYFHHIFFNAIITNWFGHKQHFHDSNIMGGKVYCQQAYSFQSLESVHFGFFLVIGYLPFFVYRIIKLKLDCLVTLGYLLGWYVWGLTVQVMMVTEFILLNNIILLFEASSHFFRDLWLFEFRVWTKRGGLVL